MITVIEIAFGSVVGILLFFASIFSYMRTNAGFDDENEVQKTTADKKTKSLTKTTTIFYKHHIGDYNSVKSELSQLVTLLPTGVRTIQILYDDDTIEPSNRLQSAYGCIFGEDGQDFYTQNFASQLKRFGYERLVVKPLGEAVWIEYRITTGFLSKYNTAWRIHPVLRNAAAKSGKLTDTNPIIVHVFDHQNNITESIVPLENSEEFIDAQHLTSDELTGKLARQCFDSDAESSESEPDDFSDDETKQNDDKHVK